MSIQTELARLTNAKAAIQAAIEGKGVTVPDGTLLDGMAALIDAIEAGGSSGGVLMGTFTPATSGVVTIDLTEYGYKFGTFPRARFIFETGKWYNSSSHKCRRTLVIFDANIDNDKPEETSSYLNICAYQSSGSNSTSVAGSNASSMWNNTSTPSGRNAYYSMVGYIKNTDVATLKFHAFDPTTGNNYGCIVGRQYIWGVIL